jgi:Amiloride-sensitive sodium channel
MFCYLMFEITEKFITNQIVTKLSKQQYSVGVIPFPAVTVCPEFELPENLPEILKSISQNSSDDE